MPAKLSKHERRSASFVFVKRRVRCFCPECEVRHTRAMLDTERLETFGEWYGRANDCDWIEDHQWYPRNEYVALCIRCERKAAAEWEKGEKWQPS